MRYSPLPNYFLLLLPSSWRWYRRLRGGLWESYGPWTNGDPSIEHWRPVMAFTPRHCQHSAGVHDQEDYTPPPPAVPSVGPYR